MFFQKIAIMQRKIVYNINQILKPFGLSVGDWRVFLYLSRTKSSALAPICEFYEVDKAVLTRIATRLYKLGFIEFLESDDRREKIIALSAKGKEAYYDISFCIREYENKVLCDIKSDEKDLLLQMIDKINHNLESIESAEYVDSIAFLDSAKYAESDSAHKAAESKSTATKAKSGAKAKANANTNPPKSPHQQKIAKG